MMRLLLPLLGLTLGVLAVVKTVEWMHAATAVMAQATTLSGEGN